MRPVCFDISQALAVDNFTFHATVSCTDASTWTWTLTSPEMTVLDDDSFTYSVSNSPLSVADPSYSGITISYSLIGVANAGGSASGDFGITSMSWDHNGVHYNCSAPAENWSASRG
jgi:hypothetical protein